MRTKSWWARYLLQQDIQVLKKAEFIIWRQAQKTPVTSEESDAWRLVRNIYWKMERKLKEDSK